MVTRGNARATVFHCEEDYREFLKVLDGALERVGVRLLAYCLMPNHVHFVLWPAVDGDLARWMHWLLTCHVRRHHERYGTDGRLWQGRFKAFPIQDDDHLLTVMRYVERNALAAGLVERADEWPWSSASLRSLGAERLRLHPSPVPLPNEWCRMLDAALHATELRRLQECVARERPYGAAGWVAQISPGSGLARRRHRLAQPPIDA